MAMQDLDFRRIRPLRGGRDRGFEELVCQLASLEPMEAGSVFYRKGIGADAGVECFVRHASGLETGWQAKYFFELGTSQVSQLNKACDKHPQLTRFVVGLPFDLRDARGTKKQTELKVWEDWKRKWETNAEKNGRTLQIDLWSASQLTERLGRDSPRYRGRAAFWFDEVILTPRWIAARFDVVRWSRFPRQGPKVDFPMRRTIQHEDTQTVYGRVQGQGRA
jgi:hypothetical protein